MRNATGLLRYRADRRPSRRSTSTTSRRPVRVGQRSPAAPAGLGHRGSPRTGAPCSARTLRTPLFWKRSLSAGGHLDRRRAVGQVHRVGRRDEHFARSLEALPAVRGADVVHQHQVSILPPLVPKKMPVRTPTAEGAMKDRHLAFPGPAPSRRVTGVELDESSGELGSGRMMVTSSPSRTSGKCEMSRTITYS